MKLNPRTFVAQVDRVFAKTLAAFGFEPDGERHDEVWYACRRYRCGKRYIEITANCDPRDGDPDCRVILGEGSNDWPDRDWNAIALCELRGTGGTYPISSVRKIPSILGVMGRELQIDGKDFLEGNLERFYEKRAARTHQREPYKIYVPKGDGTWEMIIELESWKLKKRYSRRKKA